MKRILTLLYVSMFCTYINAQLFSKEAFNANKGWGLGLVAGGMNVFDDPHFGAGFTVRIRGFYFDFWGTQNGGHENDVRYEKWSDKLCVTGHVGYQIPVTKRFRLIPVVGLARIGEEYTDGTNWTVEDGEIHNSTSSDMGKAKFDCGAVASIKLWKRTNLLVGATIHSFYGGISWNFGKID